MDYVLISAAMVAAINAGIFLAFSDFIMPSFETIPPTSGREAMQAINSHVYGSIFLVLLLGLGPVAAALAVWAALAGQWIVVIGGLAYVLGVIGVTVVGNVPMNKRLDHGDAAAPYWPTYQRGWTLWNHLRTGANVVATICFALGAVAV